MEGDTMKVSVLIAVIAVLVFTVSGAFASVIPATTSQTWTFATEANPASPDQVDNPFGSPTALISVDENGTGYTDTFPEVYGSAQGWWDIGTGSVVLTIPNGPNTGPGTYKDIVVWVKYWKDISDAPDVQVSPTSLSSGVTSTKLEDGPVGGAWWADTWSFHIEPNPTIETITLAGAPGMGSQIDEIKVDTVCAAVPEPGSLMALCSGLLGVAGLAVRRKRV
jgi:hypothetical protein